MFGFLKHLTACKTRAVMPTPRCPIIIRVNDFEYFDMVWGPLKGGASKELGTHAQACTTIREAEQILRCTGSRSSLYGELEPQSVVYTLSILKNHFSESSQTLVGDPDDVHYIIPPMHRIGYVLWKSGEVVCEHIEELDQYVEVLRQGGHITAVKRVGVSRMERYRNHEVI